MLSRYRIVWRRLLQVRIKYQNINNVRFPKRSCNLGAMPFTLGFSLLTLLGFEKTLSPEDELILSIKHCILFIQRTEFDKAEQLLHVALRQAQQIHHHKAITYIYDVMGNLALEREQYDKAKKLFVSVTQRIMADGVSEDDPRVIQLNAKLARISHMQKEFSTAQLGFDWCLNKLYKIFKEKPSDGNKKLLAMTEDWYGRLFLECNKTELGLKYLEKSYNNMKDLPDIESEHLVIQLNDIGTVCVQLGDIDKSIEYFSQGIDMGKKIQDMKELGVLYVNLGRAYMKKLLIEEARKSCGYGWKLGSLSKNEDIKREAQECLKELKNLT